MGYDHVSFICVGRRCVCFNVYIFEDGLSSGCYLCGLTEEVQKHHVLCRGSILSSFGYRRLRYSICDIAFRVSEFHLRPRLIGTAEHACANSRRCTRSLYIFAIAAGGVVQRFLLDRKVGGDENFKQKSLV